MIKKIGIIMIIIAIFLLGGIAIYSLFFADITYNFLKHGFIPRIISWSCLIAAAYGMARGKMSFKITMIFFFIAFFFAYLGMYIPFFKNFY